MITEDKYRPFFGMVKTGHEYSYWWWYLDGRANADGSDDKDDMVNKP